MTNIGARLCIAMGQTLTRPGAERGAAGLGLGTAERSCGQKGKAPSSARAPRVPAPRRSPVPAGRAAAPNPHTAASDPHVRAPGSAVGQRPPPERGSAPIPPLSGLRLMCVNT